VTGDPGVGRPRSPSPALRRAASGQFDLGRGASGGCTGSPQRSRSPSSRTRLRLGPPGAPASPRRSRVVPRVVQPVSCRPTGLVSSNRSPVVHAFWCGQAASLPQTRRRGARRGGGSACRRGAWSCRRRRSASLTASPPRPGTSPERTARMTESVMARPGPVGRRVGRVGRAISRPPRPGPRDHLSQPRLGVMHVVTGAFGSRNPAS
jgi:hypothetical protein